MRTAPGLLIYGKGLSRNCLSRSDRLLFTSRPNGSRISLFVQVGSTSLVECVVRRQCARGGQIIRETAIKRPRLILSTSLKRRYIKYSIVLPFRPSSSDSAFTFLLSAFETIVLAPAGPCILVDRWIWVTDALSSVTPLSNPFLANVIASSDAAGWPYASSLPSYLEVESAAVHTAKRRSLLDEPFGALAQVVYRIYSPPDQVLQRERPLFTSMVKQNSTSH